MQIPEVGGGLVAMDPHTGRVLAVVGGFSFAMSQFDRALQAKRQPGSSFKPFVYAAAIDNGYKPTSIILDAPIEIDQGPGQDIWKPENYEKEGDPNGPTTLRVGVEESRNQMTVRLAQDMGMPLITEYAKRFGIYDDLLPVLSMSLGAGETALLRMATAYCMVANGGKNVRPTLIDRIQDRWGHSVWRRDARQCADCTAISWANQEEPDVPDDRKQIIDPMTAYQTTSIMEGVIQRGTATSLKSLNRPLAGKTGTTNEEKDAWFIGYTPDLVVGVFIGYDTPRPMGKGNTGGHVAAPVFGGIHENGACGHARGAVPRAAGHQARACQPAHGAACKPGRSAGDRRSLQAERGTRTTPIPSLASRSRPLRQARLADRHSKEAGSRCPKVPATAADAAACGEPRASVRRRVIFPRFPLPRRCPCVTMRTAFTAASAGLICTRDPQHIHAIREAAHAR